MIKAMRKAEAVSAIQFNGKNASDIKQAFGDRISAFSVIGKDHVHTKEGKHMDESDWLVDKSDGLAIYTNDQFKAKFTIKAEPKTVQKKSDPVILPSAAAPAEETKPALSSNFGSKGA